MLRTIQDRLSSNRTSPSPRLKRLASAAGAMAVLLVASTVETQDAIANGDTRSLSMVHEHTGETLNVTFKRDGRYDRAALDQINWLMRDWRENESIKMDPRLFDVVWEAHRAGIDREYCQIEKLHNLGALPAATGFTVSCLPVKVAGASAGWCRAAAILDQRSDPSRGS